MTIIILRIVTYVKIVTFQLQNFNFSYYWGEAEKAGSVFVYIHHMEQGQMQQKIICTMSQVRLHPLNVLHSSSQFSHFTNAIELVHRLVVYNQFSIVLENNFFFSQLLQLVNQVSVYGIIIYMYQFQLYMQLTGGAI